MTSNSTIPINHNDDEEETIKVYNSTSIIYISSDDMTTRKGQHSEKTYIQISNFTSDLE